MLVTPALAHPARRRSPTGRGSPGTSPRGARSALDAVLDLQRAAGNAAVVHAIQRRTEPGEGQSQGGYLPSHDIRPAKPAPTPPGVAEHLMTEAELADLPAVGDTPALIAEYKQIQASLEARQAAVTQAQKSGQPVDPATQQLIKDEQARLAEVNRKLTVRTKGDEEETLKANGITTGHRAWFAEVTTVKFLGHDIVCHRLLAERLQKAADALQGETPPARGWFTNAHSLRKVGESLHSFGLAIDIDGGRNPYLVNPDAANARYVESPARSRAIADIINRAMLLVEGKTPAEADLQSRPTDADKDARAMASYDKLQTASSALQQYLKLDQADQKATLDALVLGLTGKDPRDAKKWVTQIAADRTKLQSLAPGKSWSAPETGFLNLDRRLVKALTSSSGGGLTWLGDDTIGSGRDIMHFDMRGPGPIRRIVKTLEGKTVSLGSG